MCTTHIPKCRGGCECIFDSWTVDCEEYARYMHCTFRIYSEFLNEELCDECEDRERRDRWERERERRPRTSTGRRG